MNYLIVQLTGNEALIARFQLNRGILVIEGASRETIDHEHTLASHLAAAAAAKQQPQAAVLFGEEKEPGQRLLMRGRHVEPPRVEAIAEGRRAQSPMCKIHRFRPGILPKR